MSIRKGFGKAKTILEIEQERESLGEVLGLSWYKSKKDIDKQGGSSEFIKVSKESKLREFLLIVLILLNES